MHGIGTTCTRARTAKRGRILKRWALREPSDMKIGGISLLAHEVPFGRISLTSLKERTLAVNMKKGVYL